MRPLLKSTTILLVSACMAFLVSTPLMAATNDKMPITTSSDQALEYYKQGRSFNEALRVQEARQYFQKAIDYDREIQAKAPRMKSASYLGLALTMAQGRSQDAIKLCEQAVKREFYDADLYCNLGIVYLRNRRRGPAFEAFRRGLALKPKHRRIHDELDRYDRRLQPTFGFLPRNHLVNRLAGRIRSRMRDLFDRTAASEA